MSGPWAMFKLLMAVDLMGDETRLESDLIGDCSSNSFDCAVDPPAAADGCLDASLVAAAARGALLFTILCRLSYSRLLRNDVRSEDLVA